MELPSRRALATALFLLLVPALARAQGSSPRTFVLDGPIGTANLQALESASPTAFDRIALDSPGGDFFVALALARLVKERGLVASVGFAGRCDSACVVVFQAGRRRIAHPTASFAYHAVSTRRGDRVYVNAAWTRLLKDSLAANGASPALLARIDENVFRLEARAAMTYGVVTEIDRGLH